MCTAENGVQGVPLGPSDCGYTTEHLNNCVGEGWLELCDLLVKQLALFV